VVAVVVDAAAVAATVDFFKLNKTKAIQRKLVKYMKVTSK
jgi:hypothetical protein